MDRFDIIVMLDRLHCRLQERPQEELDDAYHELISEFDRYRDALKSLGLQQWVIDNKPNHGDVLVTVVEPEGGPVTRTLKSRWPLPDEVIAAAGIEEDSDG